VSAGGFYELCAHVGHDVVVVAYMDEDMYTYNVAIECEDCCAVLLDFDRPEPELRRGVRVELVKPQTRRNQECDE
jgi:hypothetical protein